MKDFTHHAYQCYLHAIKSSYPNILRFDEFIKMSTEPSTFCIIRHDVDRKPKSALKMARLENRLGVKATYYFRTKSHCFKPEIIKEIASLGHEIGYHFESLSDSNGNMEKALEDFGNNFKKFSEIVPIKTISSHGLPLKRFNNLDIWKDQRNHNLLFNKHGILCCICLDIDFKNIIYISDTGRNWSSRKFNIRDYVPNCISIDFRNGAELYNFFISHSQKRIVFQIHPERWTSNLFKFIMSYLIDFGTNIVKFIYVKIIFKKRFRHFREEK